MIRVSFVVIVLAWVAALSAQEAPKPTREHRLLQDLVGEWESESEAILEPGKPPMKSKGTESVRAVGPFWIMAENRGDAFGMPFTGVLTLGYDATKKKPLATWIDSMNSHLVSYDGTLNEAGNILTLTTEVANPALGGKLTKAKDVIEIKSKDHKVLTSSMEIGDGKWVTYLTVSYKRKK
jgi:hypothetical protein